MATQEVEHFILPSGKRKISLLRRSTLGGKPWLIVVYVKTHGTAGQVWTILSTSEYFEEEVALKDFNARREAAGLKVREEPALMQRGKRVVQEIMTEKLGPLADKKPWEL